MRLAIALGQDKGRKPTAEQSAFLADGPAIDVGTALLVRAYAVLSTEKATGMTLGPLPVRAIWAWCDRHGLSPDAARHTERVLRRVDGVMLRRAASKAATRT